MPLQEYTKLQGSSRQATVPWSLPKGKPCRGNALRLCDLKQLEYVRESFARLSPRPDRSGIGGRRLGHHTHITVLLDQTLAKDSTISLSIRR